MWQISKLIKKKKSCFSVKHVFVPNISRLLSLHLEGSKFQSYGLLFSDDWMWIQPPKLSQSVSVIIKAEVAMPGMFAISSLLFPMDSHFIITVAK